MVSFHHHTVQQRLVAHQITFPVTGNEAVFYLGWSFAEQRFLGSHVPILSGVNGPGVPAKHGQCEDTQ